MHGYSAKQSYGRTAFFTTTGKFQHPTAPNPFELQLRTVILVLVDICCFWRMTPQIRNWESAFGTDTASNGRGHLMLIVSESCHEQLTEKVTQTAIHQMSTQL